MSESAGKYSMMISGAAEPLAEAVRASGMGRFVSGISGVPKGASLERALILHPADILVITDEAALSFAPTAYKKGCLAVLLLCDEAFDRRACVELGVFCGATNCPITALLIGFELFGFQGMPYYLVAVSVSYMMSGYHGLYKEQKIVYSKYQTRFINRNPK